MFEILCLVGVAAVVFHLVVDRLEVRERERVEAERQAKEQRILEEQKMLEEKEREEKRSEWNLILVNNDHAIPDGYEVDVVEIEDGYHVDKRIKEPLERMLADCREAGYNPAVISAYRSHEKQQELYDNTANKADTAVPGHSEHECGLSLDIVDADSLVWGDPLVDKQEEMPAQKWLMEHCQDYGFILRYPKDKEDVTEIIYEPWHYRYVGEEHAKKIMSEGICLEEYIEQL